MSTLSELTAQRDDVMAELAEIESLSDEGRNRILDAIKAQRWYFFKNNKYILMDKLTGLLWANLDYFNYKDGTIGNFDEVSRITEWAVPRPAEMIRIVEDARFPFKSGARRIKSNDRAYWKISTSNDIRKATGDISLDTWNTDSNPTGCLIPCNRSLLADKTTYAQDVDPNNKIYSETERLQFTLDLFTQNDLWPIFNDDEITQLYGKIYIDKPALLGKLQELNEQIAPLMTTRILSSEFDYTAMLAQYDLPAVNSSVIKYFEALKKWTDDLMAMIEDFEREKDDTIRQFGVITLKLSKKYEDSPALSRDENNLMRERLAFFLRKLSLGMNTVKAKILAVKKQALELEDRIDSADSITELAAIQDERRATFPLIAENTARIIRNALLKIEYFEAHRDFVMNAVKILTDWTEDYRVFKTTLIGQLKDSCVKDTIDARIWDSWCNEWQSLRLEIEGKLQPVLERGLNGDVPVNAEDGKSVPEEIVAVLAEYKSDVDKFFLDERKGIHQEFAFMPGGSLQEKFKAESMLYKLTSKFQGALQKIIFSCTSSADRIFILNWADSLLDLRIDGIISFVADNGLDKVSAEILDGFSALRQKNYDVYLSDAGAYSEELSRREKEYNSLMFRMRKDIAEQGEQ
ncbi:MAG: hypothetical protein IJG51_01730 [Synergistaceae bacterium]|nr:hypothetical protein [Synergistaceae bacterium]